MVSKKHIRIEQALCLIILEFLLNYWVVFHENFQINLPDSYYNIWLNFIIDTTIILSSFFIARVSLCKTINKADTISKRNFVKSLFLSLLVLFIFLFVHTLIFRRLIIFDKICHLFNQLPFFFIIFYSIYTFFAAFSEELIFKVLLFNGLRRETAIPLGFNILIVSCVFSLWHLQYYGNVGMLTCFLFQFLTLLFYCYYPSVWFTAFIHFVSNIIISIIAYSQ